MEELDFVVGWHGVAVLIVWPLIILGMGIYISRFVSKDSKHSFYVAGGGLGTIVLFFTLYASQYSGNTVIGYAPQAYRIGFTWLQSIPFMIVVLAGYMLYAPRLHHISKKHDFITPVDWFQHRFGSELVSFVAVLIMLYGLSNFLLEQLVAIGHAVAGLTAGVVPYQFGVLFLVVIMLLYEWLGGMQAVAIADTFNGVLLLLGVFGLLFFSFTVIGGLGEATEFAAQNFPDRVGAPDTTSAVNWLSMLMLTAFGATMYPHAIQRIYAAESEATLKKSFKRMAWMPFLTTGVVFVVGIIGLKEFPGLGEMEAEELIGMMAARIAGQSGFHYFLMLLLFCGIMGAIMSTADSIILAISSLISNDLYARHINPDASEKKQVLVGKIGGIVLVGLLILVAWFPPGTLYEIFVLKLEIMTQIAPAFMLGLYWERLNGKAVLVGMLVGSIIGGGMTIAGMGTIAGVHGGIIGLAVNFAICVVGSLLLPQSETEKELAEEYTQISA
ncbi:sodium:solute symporter family protein [Halarsenatibacter silvermanii]|uniref:Transporter, SSS family n=1 Tax=Halarsenatibacter silvermanii TaxID=321763 RepID=A0A1G9HD63_9FIRM|nr:sodium:solute symporter family protein [Halarsenatibacter silvermanii]SDL10433.1 transporter, SSS family [Halarsenatibacter silvermanii]